MSPLATARLATAVGIFLVICGIAVALGATSPETGWTLIVTGLGLTVVGIAVWRRFHDPRL